ncbi:MAG: hypothetical protein NTZ94_18705 [Verrucomicrobia bacterium]|nr:hypothetical protein [Verrucomicrobiota bacterium]
MRSSAYSLCIAIRAATSKFIVGNFLAAVFSGAVSVVSVGFEDEDGTVLEGDFDWLSGCGVLVEQVEARLSIVVGDPFADGLSGWFDGLEGFDVEGRVGWWREAVKALSSIKDLSLCTYVDKGPVPLYLR